MLNEQDEAQHFISYLILHIGQEKYAIRLAFIREILLLERLQVMPFVPPLVRGVMNVRGNIMPIIDAGIRLGKARIHETAKTNVLVIHVSHQQKEVMLGLMVDEIKRVEIIDMRQVEQALSFGAGIKKEFIEGMIKIDQELVILLSVQHLLSLTELEEMIGQDV